MHHKVSNKTRFIGPYNFLALELFNNLCCDTWVVWVDVSWYNKFYCAIMLSGFKIDATCKDSFALQKKLNISIML